MAAENGDASHALIQQLWRDPQRFGFFAALRLLERVYAEKVRFGEGSQPWGPARLEQEPARLGQEPSLTPSRSNSVVAVDPDQSRLFCSFFGLLGASGVMPAHFTQFAIGRRYDRDDSFLRFLDIFHHRLLGLYYRAWADVEPAASIERRDAAGFSYWLAALLGSEAPADANRDTFPGIAMLLAPARHTGPGRSADTLIAMVDACFGSRAEIQEFVPEWVPLQEGGRWRLGARRQPASLGANTLLGARVLSVQHKIRIRIHLSTLADFSRFAGHTPDMERLETLLMEYLGGELDWEIEFALPERQMPLFQLGRATVGRTTWLQRASDTQSGDVTLQGARSARAVC